MRMVYHGLLMIAAAVLGLAVGIAWRGKLVAESQPRAVILPASATSNDAHTKPSGSLKPRGGISPRDDSPLATQLERDLSMSTGVTRWLCWLEALEKAAPSDFPRLARLAQGNATATRFVAARWAETAPRHMFDTLVAAVKSGRMPDYELATTLFEEWPRRDPDAAIAALNETDNVGMRKEWQWDLAYALVEKDIERALRLMAEWHVDNTGFGSRGIAAVTKWTRANPRHAAEFMVELDQNAYSFRSAMEALGNEWGKMDPANALAFAVSKPGELSSTLAQTVLKEWAGRNLNEAADWVSRAETPVRNRLSPALVEIWAKEDADHALSWCEENLTGSALNRAVNGVLRGAAEKNVVRAAELVATMDPSSARAEAAVAVARKWFPELASGKAVAPEAIAWLAGLDPGSVKKVMNTTIASGWATSDPKTMAAFIAAVNSEQVPNHVYNEVGRELARRNPAEALDWASRLPGDHALSAGSEVFGEWRNAQPEAAMKWLNDLPATDPRRQPYLESAMRSLAYHPQAAEQIAAMNATDRATLRTVIESITIPEDRRTRLLDLLKSQSP